MLSTALLAGAALAFVYGVVAFLHVLDARVAALGDAANQQRRTGDA